jgi:hypothetical protein
MKKALRSPKLTLHRETLRQLSRNELTPVAGGFTGPDSHCTSLLCPTRHSVCPCH